MRRLLYPIFLPFVMWGLLVAIWIGQFLAPSPPSMTDPTSSNGFVALAAVFFSVVFGGAFQLVLGWPSSIILKQRRGSLLAHLVTGGTLGLTIAGIIGYVMIQDRFDESLRHTMPFIALFVIPPFLAGYLRLFFLHAHETGQKKATHPAS